MPNLEPARFSVVKSWHIDLRAQQCVWLLVAISTALCTVRLCTAIPGGARRSGVPRFFDPLLAMRPAALADLSFDPHHDPAHFRQTAQQALSRREGASRSPVRA